MKTLPPRSSTTKAVVVSCRVEPLRADRDRAGGGRDVRRRLTRRQRYDDVDALRAAGLDQRRHAHVAERLPHQQRAVDRARRKRRSPRAGRGRRPGASGRRTHAPEQGRVVLDRALVGEPQQGLPVVAHGIVDHPLPVLGRDVERRDRRGGVRRQVLLHERRLAAQHPDHAQRAPGEHRHEPVRDSVQVVDQVALAGAGVGEQRLVEIGQPDAGPFLLGHADILPPSGHRLGDGLQVKGRTTGPAGELLGLTETNVVAIGKSRAPR